METITIDGVDEHAFRYAVEDMLRHDNVDEATERLRGLLQAYAGEGRLLPSRFLSVTAAEVEITGWERLASRLASHDRPQFPISAIGVVLSDARVLGGPGPQGGRLAPFIKTYYFSDDAYPFTNAARDDLLDGYTREGFGWQGDYQATDATLAIKGIDDLHGAIIELEDRLLDSTSPSEDELRAGTIGACFLAALIHQALRDTIRKQGLPRPLCVLAACDGVYPFFDAPVAGWDLTLDACEPEAPAEDAWPNELEEGSVGAGLEGSLLSITSRRTDKHLALQVGEDDLREAERFTADAAASRLVITDDNALRGLFHGIAAVELDPGEAIGREAEFPVDEASWHRAPAQPGSVGGEEGPPAAPAPGEAPAVDFPETVSATEANIAEPAPAPDPVDIYFEAREAFKRAELAKAFPSGSSLRSRFKEEPPRQKNPALAQVQAAVHGARRKLLRGGLLLRRKTAAAGARSADAARRLGHGLARAGCRIGAAVSLASWRKRLRSRPPRSRR